MNVFTKCPEIPSVSMLLDKSISRENKYLAITNIVRYTNNSKNLMILEKYMYDEVKLDQIDTYTKLRLIDRFLTQSPSMLIKTVDWMYATAAELFWCLYNQDITIENKITCMHYLLRSIIQQQRKEIIIREMMDIGQQQQNTMNLSAFSSLVDALLHCGNKDAIALGDTLLQVLRRREAEAAAAAIAAAGHDMMFWPRMPKDIYNDTQNVHDSTIENSVKEFLAKIAQDVHDKNFATVILPLSPIDIIDDLLLVKPVIFKEFVDEKISKDNARKIKESLQRIATDYAIFSKAQLRLRDILQRVLNRIYNYIQSDEERKEAMNRLRNELIDAYGKCSTGYMGRLANILSGFNCVHPEGKSEIISVVKISYEDQIKSNIQARINTSLRSADEKVMDALIETEAARQPYLDFLKEIKEKIYEELLLEFSEIFNKDFTKDKFTEIFEKYYIIV